MCFVRKKKYLKVVSELEDSKELVLSLKEGELELSGELRTVLNSLFKKNEQLTAEQEAHSNTLLMIERMKDIIVDLKGKNENLLKGIQLLSEQMDKNGLSLKKNEQETTSDECANVCEEIQPCEHAPCEHEPCEHVSYEEPKQSEELPKVIKNKSNNKKKRRK